MPRPDLSSTPSDHRGGRFATPIRLPVETGAKTGVRRAYSDGPRQAHARGQTGRFTMSRLAVFTLVALLVLVELVTGAPATGTIVDDFEDRDLISVSGSAWVPIGDDLLGGTTTLRLEPVRGASGSRGALRLTGTIGSEAT